MEKSKTTIVVRCDEQLKEDAKRAAKAANRNLSNFIETLLRSHLYNTLDVSKQTETKKDVETDSPLSNMKHNF